MALIDLFDTGTQFHFPYMSTISIVIIVAGFLIIVIGGYAFKKVQTTVNPNTPNESTELVTTGIYSVSRNPMYIAYFSWLVACALFLGNLINFILLPVFIVLVNKLYIIPEENALLKIFGDDYAAYQQRVRRWI